METVVMILAVLALMYFFMFRPANKRMREQQQMHDSITEGNRVRLASGMFATVKAVGEQQLVAEIAPGVEVTVLKGAVAGVVAPEDEEFEYADDEPVEPIFEPENQLVQQPTVLPAVPTPAPAPAVEPIESPVETSTLLPEEPTNPAENKDK